MTKKLILPLAAVFVTSCAPKFEAGVHKIASETTEAIGCAQSESKTWDAVNRFLIENKEIPSVEDLKSSLRVSLRDVKSARPLTEKDLDTLAGKLSDLFETLLVEAPQQEGVTSAEHLLSLLSALELGDRTTAGKVKLQAKLEGEFKAVREVVSAMEVQCSTPDQGSDFEVQPTPPPFVEASVLSAPVVGMRRAIATAYQTCQALSDPAMTASTPDVEGIKITGKHPDGVGNKRVVGDVNALLRTHAYYKNVNNYAAGCLDVRSTPLIYDYGGKPYATTDSGSPLNLFKNAGDGTTVLGIDCSGLVYSALATAGLKVHPQKMMKATGVYGIGSTMYVEPQDNGLLCLAKISMNAKESLKAGDIVAVPGHVLMIDSAGADPFGLNYTKTSADCSKLAVKNFDFVVAQSSPSKNGIGINRFEARDYLPESDKMRTGLLKYAYYACLARYDGKKYTPSLGSLSVIRHKQTAECLGPRIKLTQESCVANCDGLVR